MLSSFFITKTIKMHAPELKKNKPLFRQFENAPRLVIFYARAFCHEMGVVFWSVKKKKWHVSRKDWSLH